MLQRKVNLLHWGLQRSGTNFLETLVLKNYRVCFLNSNKDRRSPLQKHCRFYKNKQIIPEPQYHNDIVVESFEQFESLFTTVPDYYLVISKDPYSWYLSYRNWAVKCRWPEVWHHYIEEYNLFYELFMKISAQTDKFIFIKYIDLLKDADGMLNDLGEKMKLRKRLFAGVAYKKPGKVIQSEVFTEEKRRYYLEHEYLPEYSKEDLKMLNHLIDPEVIDFLGYSLQTG